MKPVKYHRPPFSGGDTDHAYFDYRFVPEGLTTSPPKLRRRPPSGKPGVSPPIKSNQSRYADYIVAVQCGIILVLWSDPTKMPYFKRLLS